MFSFKTFPKSILFAVLGVILAVTFAFNNTRKQPDLVPEREPSKSPFEKAIAGTGIVESYRENVAIAPYRAGKVVTVFVKEGQHVTKGMPLFAIEASEIQNRIQALTAQIESQGLQIQRLQNEPRNTELPPLLAQVNQTKAVYEDQQQLLASLQSVTVADAISTTELNQRQKAMESARAAYEQALAQYNRVKAGAWSFDIKAAQAQLKSLQAQRTEQQTLLNQATIRAPRDGEILKVNTRAGQFVNLNDTDPAILLGDTQNLQIRVDIDEVNASKVKAGATAEAYLKGDNQKKIDLIFDRVVPYMVPKRNLSGASTERVDIRVLQLIYKFKPPSFPVYVGQQVDVYLKE